MIYVYVTQLAFIEGGIKTRNERTRSNTSCNSVVKSTSKPSLKSFDSVLYSIMMAPTSNKAANMALKYGMNIDIFLMCQRPLGAKVS